MASESLSKCSNSFVVLQYCQPQGEWDGSGAGLLPLFFPLVQGL